ncbi:MAG: VCBS repeat-containing protein [Phycisphaerales bacterium]|nr:VCBS repeat-containing protein [Phycisphaerales bacterium]
MPVRYADPRATLTPLVAVFLIGLPSASVSAQGTNLAGYFGFGELEVLKVGRRAGPVTVADLDGDGRNDLVIVNNHASRIELHRQRPDATPDDAMPPTRVNEFPELWRFERTNVSVTHGVTAITAADYDADGRMDLIYASATPSEVVFLRQGEMGRFDVDRRHRVRDLAPIRDGLAFADVLGDDRPELLAVVGGDVKVWPLESARLGPPTTLATVAPILAIMVDDLDGDGRGDIVGISPDDPAPVRVWFGDHENGHAVIGGQHRFEMPPLIEATTVRLPNRAAARLAVIERPSRRIVLYDVDEQAIEPAGDREASMRIYSFTDEATRDRDHAVVDVDGDGRLDLVATDTEASALVVYRQRSDHGFRAGVSNPSLTQLTHVAAANLDTDPSAEILVLSAEEGVVGRCEVGDGGRVRFPLPLQLSPRHTPTAMNLVELEGGPRVAVVAKDGRAYALALVDMTGGVEMIELGRLSRSPETTVALDADQDGRTDLLLFTRDKPMTMLRATESGFRLTESKDMGQYGLVQAAKAENIAVLDVDGDDRPELLIADRNFVRAVRYDASPPAGVSPGWQVVTQINARRRDSDLVSLAIVDGQIVAADQANERLVIMARADGAWEESEALSVPGFGFTTIHACDSNGAGRRNILAVGEAGFAVLQTAGRRATLAEVGAWRSSDERQLPHELGAGDVNGDGFTDLVALDAGEQMCEIFTFTQRGHLLHAVSFKVFESRVFSGAESREFEPSQVIIADVTGDGGQDLLMLAHDRVLVYPAQP